MLSFRAITGLPQVRLRGACAAHYAAAAPIAQERFGRGNKRALTGTRNTCRRSYSCGMRALASRDDAKGATPLMKASTTTSIRFERPTPETRRSRRPTAPEIDRRALAAALARRVRGEIRFDDGSRALYATDASNYRQVPIGVVVPRTVDDVVQTVAVCRAFAAPILARGGGTSLAGQCCNVAVVIDMSKYLNAIVEIDPERRLARVQPGVVLDDLRDATRTLWPDVRSRSGDARPLHARRHDWQQFVRRPLGNGRVRRHWRAHVRQRGRPRRSHVRRHSHARRTCE